MTLQSDRGGSCDSFGAPRTKETRLDSEELDCVLDSVSDTPTSAPPLLAHHLNSSPLFHSVSSPSRSLREKITDYFGYNKEGSDYFRSRSCSPEMPVLMPQVNNDQMIDKVDSPPQLSDGEGSEQSCGNSDSGKENEEDCDRWRGGGGGSKTTGGTRPRSDSNKMPLQQSQPVAAGRITRSASGKVPLSLKGCENLQNELNIAEGSLKSDYKEKEGAEQSSPPSVQTSAATNPQSPPTPHKIIRVKEPSICNPLHKLKSISLTPKKSTKSNKQTKR